MPAMEKVGNIARLAQIITSSNSDHHHKNIWLEELRHCFKADWSATDQEINKLELALNEGLPKFNEKFASFSISRLEDTDFFTKIEREIHKLAQKLRKQPFNLKSNELDKLVRFVFGYVSQVKAKDDTLRILWSVRIVRFLGIELQLSELVSGEIFIQLKEMVSELFDKISSDEATLYYMLKLGMDYGVMEIRQTTI